MRQDAIRNDNRRLTLRQIFIALWAVDFTILLLALVYPVSTGILRLLVAISIPFLLLLGIYLVHHKRLLAITLALSGLVFIVFSVLPGRAVCPAKLRAEYVRQLRKYDGTAYVWGGENGFGIDCSGLIRRSLINAYMHLAFTTANPGALRSAIGLWWHDCSARALRDQYRGLTIPVCTAASIDTLADRRLYPGDLAVISSGIHILAYLGKREWIQADPSAMKVITLKVPQEKDWFVQPVCIVRWSQMNQVPVDN